MTTAAEAAARDRAAIAAGTPSFDLMLRAGTAAAALILRDYGDRLAHGVALYAGAGNNGGDAYVVAAQLARAGVPVRLHASAPPRTDDATRARVLAEPALTLGAPTGGERVVVDGLLGTGHRGDLRDGVALSCERMQYAADGGATVVALDVPTGLDGTTGAIAHGSVPASLTLCFGTLKRGVLFERAHAGRIVVLDIGLRQHVRLDDDAWTFADPARVAQALPRIAWNAHKGTRGGLILVGGAAGMAGAMTLATRAALASGVGLAKSWVEGDGVAALQRGVPQAIAHEWREGDALTGWGDALAIGPGLGRSKASRTMLERTLARADARPVVLDADALSLAALDHDTTDAADVIATWRETTGEVVCTPHPGEFARLTRGDIEHDWQRRADALSAFAVRSGATVLLKGTPTLVATPDGQPPTAIARGTALLATGGSGDLLTGIIGALLAAGMSGRDAAMVGASVHGAAAEIVTMRAGTVRGPTLEAVLDGLPEAWRSLATPATFHQDVLCELPAPVT